MRFKESLALDHLIDVRRGSLCRFLSHHELDQRAQALSVLIQARDELDRIAGVTEAPDVREHIRFTGTDEDGRRIKPRQRRDQRRRHDVVNIASTTSEISGREIAKILRREFRQVRP